MIPAPTEREAFERWAQALIGNDRLSLAWNFAGYVYSDTASAWRAWQARAALAASPPGVSQEPGGFRCFATENTEPGPGQPYGQPVMLSPLSSVEQGEPQSEARPQISDKVAPNNDEVICPACAHQFRAIPINVQNLMLDAGFEPPFTHSPRSTDEQAALLPLGAPGYAV